MEVGEEAPEAVFAVDRPQQAAAGVVDAGDVAVGRVDLPGAALLLDEAAGGFEVGQLARTVASASPGATAAGPGSVS